MKRQAWIRSACTAGLALAAALCPAAPPNLLIIHTDEHNFRTLDSWA